MEVVNGVGTTGDADAGNNLIVEHILDTPGWADVLRALFREHDILFVAVHCALPELAKREAQRADRRIGSAIQDQRSIHAGHVYDLDVDSEDGVDANVELILQAWRSGLRQSEFN